MRIRTLTRDTFPPSKLFVWRSRETAKYKRVIEDIVYERMA